MLEHMLNVLYVLCICIHFLYAPNPRATPRFVHQVCIATRASQSRFTICTSSIVNPLEPATL